MHQYSIAYLFYKASITFKIKAVLISYSLSKAASKATGNNGLIAADKLSAGSTIARVRNGQTDDGFHRKQQLTKVIRLRGVAPMSLIPDCNLDSA